MGIGQVQPLCRPFPALVSIVGVTCLVETSAAHMSSGKVTRTASVPATGRVRFFGMVLAPSEGGGGQGGPLWTIMTRGKRRPYRRILQIKKGIMLSSFLLNSFHFPGITCVYVGVLCGSCKDGRGVSVLLNRCVSCSNASILLLVALSESTSVCILLD